MADHPILFSAPMIRALLDGRKTQTRRVMKPQPEPTGDGRWHVFNAGGGTSGISAEDMPTCALDYLRIGVGDRLWVRETWFIATQYSYGITPGGSEIAPPPLAHRNNDPVHYLADGDPPNCANRHYGPDGLRGGWFAAPDPYAIWDKKSSIHMPRWASRLTLIVTDVRVQRLQEISEEDAIAEGLEWVSPTWGIQGIANSWTGLAVEAYAALWDHINGTGAWETNPWIVAYSFSVNRCNIDQMEAVHADTA